VNEKTKKILKKVHKSLSKGLELKKRLTTYHIICFVLLTVILTAIPFYLIGRSEGYGEKEREVEYKENIEIQRDLMSKSKQEVWDLFLKFLMIKTMAWLPWIIIALCLGWIIHGIL